MVLRSRGVSIPAEVEARIQALCKDIVLLSAWLQRAVTLTCRGNHEPFQP